MKPCTHCKQIKPLSEFPAAKRASDGRGSRCNACHHKTRRTKPQAEQP